MPERELRETGGRERLELAKQRVLDIRRREREINDQLPEVYDRYQRELCYFLGIDPETRLAKSWAEGILDYAEANNLHPRMFASRLVTTIEGAQKTLDLFGKTLDRFGPAQEKAAEWSYLEAVKAMREQARPSMPEPKRGLPYLKKAEAISEEEAKQNPTMENRCQHAVYLWITQELFNLESFWWVIVGKPKQAS